MSLDLTKLENVRQTTEKTIARCPACAKDGKDKKGEHLVIFPDGRYGCVVDSSDDHRKAIFELVGLKGDRRPIPIPIRRPGCALRKARTVRTLNFNFYAKRREGEGVQNGKRSGKNPSEPSETAKFVEWFWKLIPLMDKEFLKEPVFFADEPERDGWPRLDPVEDMTETEPNTARQKPATTGNRDDRPRNETKTSQSISPPRA
jgi:hypothetical protein